jgi:hypothetical protein
MLYAIFVRKKMKQRRQLDSAILFFKKETKREISAGIFKQSTGALGIEQE